jgi:hypothetical protein
MMHAIWLASIFGPLLFFIGLWMILYSDALAKMIASMKASPAAFWLTGVIHLLLGLTITSLYGRWMWNETILITLLGWVFMVRGLLTLFAPKLLIAWTMTKSKFVKTMGYIPLFWGLALCWIAFF